MTAFIGEVRTGSAEHQQHRMEAPLHAYGYARHNPLGYRDDTGRWAWMHHDTLIDKAFANRGPITISFLKSASLIADKTAFQAAWASYRHAMGAPGQKDRAATRELLLKFIVEKLDTALEAREQGKPEYEVQGQFGLGLHGVADVSSPLHGFLEWDAAGSVGELVADIFTGRFGHAFGAIWHVVAEFFLGVWHIWLGIGDVSEKSQADLNALYDVWDQADKETIRGKRPTKQQLDERIRKGHFNDGWRNVKEDNQ